MVKRLDVPHKVIVRAGLFTVGPFIALVYSLYPIQSMVACLTIVVSALWIYLSIEDALKLSVPSLAFCGTFIITCILAIIHQNTLMEYLINFGILTVIILVLFFIQYYKKKSLAGSADFFAIFSLGMTLRADLLGPWLLITCLIPLIGLIAKKQSPSSKLPFIPYLTVGWMLAILLN